MAKARPKKDVVENITAAATRLNVGVEVVRKAKALGCPAFAAGNRVDLAELEAWLKENADKLKVTGQNLSLKDQKLNEEVRKLKIRNDRDDGILMPVADRDNEFREAFRECVSELMTIPPRSPELTGISAAEMEKRLRQMIIDALKALSLKANATAPA